MEQTRDNIYIRNQPVRHGTACRDYICSTCGGGLVTRCVGGKWMTVCARDTLHPVDMFVRKTAYQAILTRRMIARG